MEPVIQSIIAGMPVFFAHFSTGVAVFAVALTIYMRITPQRELALIRQGNSAAAISLGAGMIGLALPLAFCLQGSVSAYDIVLWGGAILAIQLLTYVIIDRILIKNIARHIEQQMLAPVIFMAALKLSVAMLNAAAIAG